MKKETFSRNEGTKNTYRKRMTCTTATLWLMGNLVMPASKIHAGNSNEINMGDRENDGRIKVPSPKILYDL